MVVPGPRAGPEAVTIGRGPGRGGGHHLSESSGYHRFRAAGIGTGRLVDITAGIGNPCRQSFLWSKPHGVIPVGTRKARVERSLGAASLLSSLW